MKFQKNVYHIADSTGAPQKVPILVHYIGEQDIEKLFVPGPHGNAKNKEIAASYLKTTPSILTEMKEKPISEKPHLVYKRADHLNKGRNLKQYQNIKHVNLFII